MCAYQQCFIKYDACPLRSSAGYSILYPVLFAAFINDLPSHISPALIFLFGDNTECFKIIPNPSNIISLQNSINQALHWSNINDLFYESKFLHVHFGNEFGSHTFSVTDAYCKI